MSIKSRFASSSRPLDRCIKRLRLFVAGYEWFLITTQHWSIVFSFVVCSRDVNLRNFWYLYLLLHEWETLRFNRSRFSCSHRTFLSLSSINLCRWNSHSFKLLPTSNRTVTEVKKCWDYRQDFPSCRFTTL